MDYVKVTEGEAYDFLRKEERLRGHLMLLGVSGSHGYGTNVEGSDLDLRGICENLPSDLLGLTSYEQFEDRTTDTVIYSFSKAVGLFLGASPNMIEILGLDPDQYIVCTDMGRKLIENRHLFLSRRAAASFGHYADNQLRRLQNAVARDTMPQEEREEHILRSVRHALEDFDSRFAGKGFGSVKLYTDTAVTKGLEREIFLDASIEHFPLRYYNELMNSLNSVIREYDRIGKRNHKKDEAHLNKHAMHLVRLFQMGIDILEKEEIITHRPAEDRALLMEIRRGGYMSDGRMTDAFYHLVADYEKRFQEAAKHSSLPEFPDREAVGRLVEEINRECLERAYA